MTKATVSILSGTLLAAAAGLFAAGSLAHERHSAPAAKAAPTHVKLLDLALINQEGRTASFKSEVIGGRIVVLDNIYTRCTTVCPVLTTIMVGVHNAIVERAGKDVSLVSLSVDPITDTPERLRAYAKRHNAAWNLWTGPKPAMDRVLKGLGIYTPEAADHPSSVLVGDGKTGEWTRFYGFASPEQILRRVDELLAARQNAALKAGAGR